MGSCITHLTTINGIVTSAEVGQIAVLLSDGDQGEDGMTVPGAAGPQGNQGVQGIQGAAGPQGVQGAPGPALLFDPDQAEDVVPIPGPPGPQGVQGAPGQTMLFEPDLGEEPVYRPFSPLPFGAAGAGHAAGLVPDAGGTAPNFARSLLDTGAFGWKAGEILAAQSVPTGQTTASTTYVDLGTADSVSFTLDAAANVIVMYKATEQLTTGGPNSTFDEIMFDGVLDGTTQSSLGFSAVGFPGDNVVLFQKAGLAAGAHTIKVQHKVDGGTGSWIARGLIVFRAP